MTEPLFPDTLHGTVCGLGNVGSPVSSSDRDDGEFGNDDSSSDGSSDFLGTLDTETDVATTISNIQWSTRCARSPVKVSDRDESLEPGPLTGRGLLLDRVDRHDLVFEGREESVHDLELLDGEGEEVDFLHRLDLAVLYESSELGDRDPGPCQRTPRTDTRAATQRTG